MKHASVQGLMQPAIDWFASRGWTPHEFQVRAWQAYLQGGDGLVNAPTGTGKTYSLWLGPLLEALAEVAGGKRTIRKARKNSALPAAATEKPPRLRVLWITPLRALATDMHGALEAACDGLGVRWRVELRTGDTSSSRKKKQRESPPDALITTPESMALLLSYPETARQFAGVRCVVVDEWHELVGTKRGVQLELCLSHLRGIAPQLRVWGLSATLGNLQEAMDVLTTPPAPPAPNAPRDGRPAPILIRSAITKPLSIRTLIPDDIERFPWAGHLGIRLLPKVIEAIEAASTSLVFTNTRSQTEIWYQSIIRARPDLIGLIALHHGSLDRDLRTWVEDNLRSGKLRCVVCTSSLDLGVDFAPVDQVIQIGSPKGVARLLQRAGRSGHQPGATSKLVCVPTNALELLEFAGAQDAIAAGSLESRTPLRFALDVLVQHIVGAMIGSGDAGLEPSALLAEVRGTNAFAGISDKQWQWCMDFASRGGPALTAYPQYARIVETSPGSERFRAASPAIARMYRQSVGTIMSDTSMLVKLGRGMGPGGRTLGVIEEGFISRLAPGDAFSFAGQVVELVRVREMTAYVRPAKRKSGRVPSWQGARMPLSTQLAAAIRRRLDDAHAGRFEGSEIGALEPLLRVQARWSHLPRTGVLVIEQTTTREGYHVFVFAMEGRLVHEGLAALVAFRIARLAPRSFTMASGDHGFNLATPEPLELTEAQWRELLSTVNLAEDLLACMNAAQLARRQFREVARVAGLVVPGFPGEKRSTRHLQASSDLFFDVLNQFDASNLLLDQSRREVLERQLEFARMRSALERLANQEIVLVSSDRLTPFAFPLWADSLREQLTSEKWTDRVQRMLVRLEAAAPEPPGGAPAAIPSAASKSTPLATVRKRGASGARSKR